MSKLTVDESVTAMHDALDEICEFPTEDMKSNFIIEILTLYKKKAEPLAGGGDETEGIWTMTDSEFNAELEKHTAELRAENESLKKDAGYTAHYMSVGTIPKELAQLKAENARLKEGIKELINSFKSSGVGWMEINEIESLLSQQQNEPKQ